MYYSKFNKCGKVPQFNHLIAVSTEDVHIIKMGTGGLRNTISLTGFNVSPLVKDIDADT